MLVCRPADDGKLMFLANRRGFGWDSGALEMNAGEGEQSHGVNLAKRRRKWFDTPASRRIAKNLTVVRRAWKIGGLRGAAKRATRARAVARRAVRSVKGCSIQSGDQLD